VEIICERTHTEAKGSAYSKKIQFTQKGTSAFLSHRVLSFGAFSDCSRTLLINLRLHYAFGTIMPGGGPSAEKKDSGMKGEGGGIASLEAAVGNIGSSKPCG